MESAAPLDQQYETIAVVGVGLIGGSIAAALKQRPDCPWIVGVGRDADRLQPAMEMGLLDEIHTDLATAAATTDLMVFCTPVDRIADGVRLAAEHCGRGMLMTDAGSVKAEICRAVGGELPNDATFIGSHPLAGSEKTGFAHADPNLFAGRVCIVTPTAQSPPVMVARVAALWQALGMTVVKKSPDEHDRLLALTSHVPHLVAGALATLLDDGARPFAASGFRDTTRIAASDPALWTAIVRANAEGITAGLDRFTAVVAEMREAVAAADWPRLQNLLQTAKTKRGGLD